MIDNVKSIDLEILIKTFSIRKYFIIDNIIFYITKNNKLNLINCKKYKLLKMDFSIDFLNEDDILVIKNHTKDKNIYILNLYKTILLLNIKTLKSLMLSRYLKIIYFDNFFYNKINIYDNNSLEIIDNLNKFTKKFILKFRITNSIINLSYKYLLREHNYFFNSKTYEEIIIKNYDVFGEILSIKEYINLIKIKFKNKCLFYNSTNFEIINFEGISDNSKIFLFKELKNLYQIKTNVNNFYNIMTFRKIKFEELDKKDKINEIKYIGKIILIRFNVINYLFYGFYNFRKINFENIDIYTKFKNIEVNENLLIFYLNNTILFYNWNNFNIINFKCINNVKDPIIKANLLKNLIILKTKDKKTYFYNNINYELIYFNLNEKDKITGYKFFNKLFFIEINNKLIKVFNYSFKQLNNNNFRLNLINNTFNECKLNIIVINNVKTLVFNSKNFQKIRFNGVLNTDKLNKYQENNNYIKLCFVSTKYLFYSIKGLKRLYFKQLKNNDIITDVLEYNNLTVLQVNNCLFYIYNEYWAFLRFDSLKNINKITYFKYFQNYFSILLKNNNKRLYYDIIYLKKINITNPKNEPCLVLKKYKYFYTQKVKKELIMIIFNNDKKVDLSINNEIISEIIEYKKIIVVKTKINYNSYYSYNQIKSYVFNNKFEKLALDYSYFDQIVVSKNFFVITNRTYSKYFIYKLNNIKKINMMDRNYYDIINFIEKENFLKLDKHKKIDFITKPVNNNFKLLDKVLN